MDFQSRLTGYKETFKPFYLWSWTAFQDYCSNLYNNAWDPLIQTDLDINTLLKTLLQNSDSLMAWSIGPIIILRLMGFIWCCWPLTPSQNPHPWLLLYHFFLVFLSSNLPTLLCWILFLCWSFIRCYHLDLGVHPWPLSTLHALPEWSHLHATQSYVFSSDFSPELQSLTPNHHLLDSTWISLWHIFLEYILKKSTPNNFIFHPNMLLLGKWQNHQPSLWSYNHFSIFNLWLGIHLVWTPSQTFSTLK